MNSAQPTLLLRLLVDSIKKTHPWCVKFEITFSLGRIEEEQLADINLYVRTLSTLQQIELG